MGLRYARGDSQNLINLLSANLSIATSTIDRLKAGSQNLTAAVDGNTLSGAAYTAGKNLFTELIIPTIDRVTGAVNSLQMDLTRYQNADHIVSGEEYLDEDNLNNQISTKKSIKSSLDYSISVYQKMAATNPIMSVGEFLFNITHQLTRMSDSLQDDIYDLQKKLEKLLAFAAQTSGLFRNSLSNFKFAMQGVLVLNDTMVNGDGTYRFPSGIDKSWFTEMKSDKDIKNSSVYALEHMPKNMTEEEAGAWVLENAQKYGIEFLHLLKKKTGDAKKGHKILDSILKFKNGKAFLNGVPITQDASGVLKWGTKFLFDKTKGTAVTTKNLFKPDSFDGTFKSGKAFKDSSGIDLATYHYSRLPNGRLDWGEFNKAGAHSFKEVAPWNDFKGWKKASNLGKVGKGLGVVSTVFTVSDNFSKNVNLDDGLQGKEVLDFATDTTIDLGTGAGATALGFALGSLIFPPLGIVVGTVLGMAIGTLLNDVKFGGPPKKSTVEHIKDNAKEATNWIGKKIKGAFGG